MGVESLFTQDSLENGSESKERPAHRTAIGNEQGLHIRRLGLDNTELGACIVHHTGHRGVVGWCECA